MRVYEPSESYIIPLSSTLYVRSSSIFCLFALNARIIHALFFRMHTNTPKAATNESHTFQQCAVREIILHYTTRRALVRSGRARDFDNPECEHIRAQELIFLARAINVPRLWKTYSSRCYKRCVFSPTQTRAIFRNWLFYISIITEPVIIADLFMRRLLPILI